MRSLRKIAMAVLCLPAVTLGAVVTLPTSSLLSLDQYGSPALNASVAAQRPGPSPASVEYEVLFPGPGPLDRHLLYGAPVTADLSDFESYALTFRFTNIDDIVLEELPELIFYVSPYVRDAADLLRYSEATPIDLVATMEQPHTVSLDVASLSVGSMRPGDLVTEMGFSIRLDSALPAASFGLTFHMEVSPVPGADPVPEPASLILLAAGVLLNTRRFRWIGPNRQD